MGSSITPLILQILHTFVCHNCSIQLHLHQVVLWRRKHPLNQVSPEQMRFRCCLNLAPIFPSSYFHTLRPSVTPKKRSRIAFFFSISSQRYAQEEILNYKFFSAVFIGLLLFVFKRQPIFQISWIRPACLPQRADLEFSLRGLR